MITTRAQLEWQCRRGTKELELLLRAFLERGFHPSAPPSDLADFARLLESQDCDLQAWLLAETEPLDSSLVPVIEKIRAVSIR